MLDSLYIAWKYLVFNKARSATLIACITLIAVLPLALEVVLDESERQLVRRADIELNVLEDGADLAALEVHRALHAFRIDRTRAHPFFDRELNVGVTATVLRDERQTHAILQMPREQILSTEMREQLP